MFLISDIDGVLVNLLQNADSLKNQAAYAEALKNATINEGNREILLSILFRAKKYHDYLNFRFITGRKKSLLKKITAPVIVEFLTLHAYNDEDAMAENEDLNVIYYPEDLEYTPIQTYIAWKIREIMMIIIQHPDEKLFVVAEDDARIATQLRQKLLDLQIEQPIVILLFV